MNYAESIAHLNGLGVELPQAGPDEPRRKFDLMHMRRLCAALGNPQDRVPSVLIAGTNGKGSTAATLASILTCAGYRTGLYTSPHLTRVNERIQLAHPVLPSEYGSFAAHGSEGKLALSQINDAAFAQFYTQVDQAGEELAKHGELPWPPSFFERLTAIAFLYFAGITDPGMAKSAPQAEIMVVEVGLGGRLDATNVVEPLLSVITDIALDHQEYLGDTLAEIAGEKAGILRQNGTLVTLSQHPEANQAIGMAATRLGVRGINAGSYLPPARRNQAVATPGDAREGLRNRYTVAVEGGAESGIVRVDSPLLGEHQRRNLALALAAAVELRERHGYKIADADLEAGIAATHWPGRLEWIEPNLLLDVAHNPAGAWTLRAAIGSLPQSQPRTLLFSCLRDKDLAEMSRILFPLFDSSTGGDRRYDHIVLAPIANPRAAEVESLMAAAHALGAPAHAAPHLAGALAQARAVTPPGGIIVATGSVYLAGEVRQLVLEPVEVSG